MSSPSSSTISKHPSNSRLQQISQHMSSAMASSFPESAVPQAPEDPLFGLMAAYRADESPNKIDLGIGAYRDDNAKPWILPVVTQADERIRKDPELNHEYLPIAGLADFTSASQKLVLHPDSQALKEKRVVSYQTISGTGAVHLGALFLSKFYKANSEPTVYLSSPTWANHNQIFTNVHLPIKTYSYFSHKTHGLDFENMIKDIRAAPEGSIIVLHACAHNPTGVDPTKEEWIEIAKVMKERKHFPFFDTAYQGFASGNLDKDGDSIRYFVDQGFEMCVAQSYAKNFGLYGQRAGCFHFITAPSPDAESTIQRISSQLAILQRSEISNPPAYGARIAALVLNNQELFDEWQANLTTMSTRLHDMRRQLRQKLEDMGTPGTWKHITDQIGMFSFTGLTEKQVEKLRKDWHVYMMKTGRISIAGLNSHNIDYFAKAVDSVVRETQ